MSLAALGQLDELMKDNEKVTYSFFSCLKTVHLPTIPNCDAFQVELLGPAIDHLFSMCCMQYRYVLQTKMKVDNANGKEVRIVVNYFVFRRAGNAGDLAGDAAAAVPHHGAHVLVRPQGTGQTCFLSGYIRIPLQTAYIGFKGEIYDLLFRFCTTW